MIADDIREWLARHPFQPFRIRTTSGESYEIRNPAMAVAMQSRLFIAFPDGDRWTMCPYLNIASVDSLQAA